MLRDNILQSWKFDLQLYNGLVNLKKLKREINGPYCERIKAVFIDIANDIDVPDTYHNRLVIIKVLLVWLNMIFPHFIKDTYDENRVLPMLIACNTDNMDGFPMGEYSLQYEEKVREHFKKKGEITKVKGMLSLLQLFYWYFARDGFDHEKFKEHAFFFSSLIDKPL